MGHGDANAPGMAHGAGKGPARGGGFGFGHASVGNPGHNALSTLSSHSQNTSHKGGTHDGRSFSNHSHSTQSLAQHQTDHSKKADQVVQVNDRGAGKEKGFVDSLPPGKELQADRGTALNQDTIQSNLADIVTLGLPPGREQLADRGMTLNIETIRSELDDIVTRELQLGQELQADRGKAFNLETIDSNPDDILELNLHRSKSLLANWQAKVAPGTIVPGTDETPATGHSHLWEFEDDRAKMLPSTNPDRDDDDEGNLGWKLVPYFGVVLLCFSRMVQSGLDARKRKAAELKFEPNALRSIGSLNGARPPTLDKFAAAFSIAGERQQKAAEEKKGALLEHFSGDPDVETARAEIEHGEEIEETFRKDFTGIGLS
jgi:hypothetical protein